VQAAIGGGWSDVNHFTGIGAGENSFKAYTLGGYSTYFAPSGWYVDGNLLGTWYDAESQSTRFPSIEPDGAGLTASLEAGVPVPLFGGWIAEPQAQLVYQTIDLETVRDVGATVRFDDANGLAGRLGVRFANTWAVGGLFGLPEPALLTGWFRPSVWHEFLGDPETEFSSETGFIGFPAELTGTWVELNTGVSTQIDGDTELYVNGSYQVGLEGEHDSWDGRIGLRVNW